MSVPCVRVPREDGEAARRELAAADLVDDELFLGPCPTVLLTGVDPLASGFTRVGDDTDLVLRKPRRAAEWDEVAKRIIDVLSAGGVG